MEAIPSLESICPHRDDVEFYCEQCNTYTCNKCYDEFHKSHNDEIILLSNMVKESIGKYSVLIEMCEKQLTQASVQPREDLLENELLRVEKDIWQSYANIIQCADEAEQRHIDAIENSKILDKVMDEKNEFEKNALTEMRRIDKELEFSLKKIVVALTFENYNQVIDYLAPEFLKGYQEDFDKCHKKKELLDRFINTVSFIKSIKPEISYSASNVSSLISVKGPFNTQLRLLTYDIESRSVLAYWPESLQLRKFPIPGIGISKGFAQVVFDINKLFICGGQYSTRSYIFSEINEQMLPMSNMKSKRAYHGICNREDKEVFVVGGNSDNDITIKSVELYQVKNNQWKNMPQTNLPKKSPVIILFGSRYLYALTIEEKQEDEFETLDVIEAKEWTKRKIELDITPWIRFGCTQISPYEILIFGGETKGKKAKSSVIYDLNKNITKRTEDLPSESYFHSEDLVKGDDRIYALSNDRSRVYCYLIKDEHWSMIYTEDFSIKYN